MLYIHLVITDRTLFTWTTNSCSSKVKCGEENNRRPKRETFFIHVVILTNTHTQAPTVSVWFWVGGRGKTEERRCWIMPGAFFLRLGKSLLKPMRKQQLWLQPLQVWSPHLRSRGKEANLVLGGRATEKRQDLSSIHSSSAPHSSLFILKNPRAEIITRRLHPQSHYLNSTTS